jgi:uncharacterized SAM-binding protein YcdF (DUF218 family)
MYREHPMPIILDGDVLGRDDKESQANYNKYFFELMGVDSEDIFIVPKGRNTETEVNALASILNGRNISLVTSASHLPRAVFTLKKRRYKWCLFQWNI